ncbi:MAG: hypothetical protein IT448_12200 [Phycisphaerales bacterium]|nr:hypothetical protein [Phycisphaerales bacterium]
MLGFQTSSQLESGSHYTTELVCFVFKQPFSLRLIARARDQPCRIGRIDAVGKEANHIGMAGNPVTYPLATGVPLQIIAISYTRGR